MLKNLKWTSLEQWRWQTRLGLLYKINNILVDVNTECFFHHSDPKTKGAQSLHQEQTQHPVLFHSFTGAVSDWSLLPMAISSAPSLKSFQSWKDHSLHNLQQVPTSPWTLQSCIVLSSDLLGLMVLVTPMVLTMTTFETHITPRLATLLQSPAESQEQEGRRSFCDFRADSD